MFCKYCGNEIGDSDKFCPNCGNQTTENTMMPANTNTASKSNNKNKTIVVAIISALLCLTYVIAIISSIKSPKELLMDNEWYSEIYVDCEYADGEQGYYFTADCKKIVFYSYGEAETTSYAIGGNGSAYGYFPYEINSKNIPSDAEWTRKVWDNTDKWEILDKKTLKYDGEYYLWDDEKETHCDCDDYDCKHEKTWYITKEYLRIGGITYASQKPTSLHVDN